MATKKLPLFYLSPTICWIDDSRLFLDAAQSLFEKDYDCLTFADPLEATKFLTTYQSPFSNINFSREFIECDIYGTHNHLPIDINITEIAKLVNIPGKRDEIAVLIIDNNMPYISGLEICHQLKDMDCKKILLTGETSPDEVIDAFNHGVIDKFIQKDENATNNLHAAIHELSYQFFYEKTKNLLSHIETSQPSVLSDSIFVEFFSEWRATNHIMEFYLINRQGSFLLKNNNNKASYFVVMSESEKNQFLKLNIEAPETLQPLLSQVKEGKKIPFFGVGKESWEFNYDAWDNYFYSAQVIEGREKYYWTAIN